MRELYSKHVIPNERINKSNLFDYVYEQNAIIVEGIANGDFSSNNVIVNTLTKGHARAHVVKHTEPDKIRVVFGIS